MLATNILLIRHGQTEWNLAGRFQGQLDSNLSPLGISQAKALASLLEQEPLEQLYSSDLGRAYDTAQILMPQPNSLIKTDARLRERAMGVFEGNTRPSIETQFPAAWKLYKSLDPGYAIEGGGESIHDVRTRTFECLENLAELHRGQSVGCVSHGGLIRIALKTILGIPFETQTRFRVQNTSVHHLVRDTDGWAVKTLGAVNHLPSS